MFPAEPEPLFFYGETVDSWQLSDSQQKKQTKNLETAGIYHFFYLASPKRKKREDQLYVAYVFEDQLWVATFRLAGPHDELEELNIHQATNHGSRGCLRMISQIHRDFALKKIGRRKEISIQGKKKKNTHESFHIFKVLPFWYIFTSQQKKHNGSPFKAIASAGMMRPAVTFTSYFVKQNHRNHRNVRFAPGSNWVSTLLTFQYVWYHSCWLLSWSRPHRKKLKKKTYGPFHPWYV